MKHMLLRLTCPVCEKELSREGACAYCGFEESKDFLAHKSLRAPTEQDVFEFWTFYARREHMEGRRIPYPTEGESISFPPVFMSEKTEDAHVWRLTKEKEELEKERYFLGPFTGRRRKSIDRRLKELEKELLAIQSDAEGKE